MLEKIKISMGTLKASFKEEKLRNQMLDTRHAEFLRSCIDLLVSGLIVMSGCLCYGAYIYSCQRITEATSSCSAIPEVPSTKNPGLPITQVYQALLLIIRYQVEEFRTALFGSRQFSVGEKMVPLICKDCNNISGLEMFVLSMTIKFGHCISLPCCRI